MTLNRLLVLKTSHCIRGHVNREGHCHRRLMVNGVSDWKYIARAIFLWIEWSFENNCFLGKVLRLGSRS